MTFFEDVAFVLQADRNGFDDFVDNIYGVKLGSDEWYEALAPRLLEHGYQRHSGALTDVVTLKEQGLKVSCANASCGYIRPHTSTEIVLTPVVENTLALFLTIAEEMSYRQWEHEYVKSSADSWGEYGGYYNNDYVSPGPWKPPSDRDFFVWGDSLYTCSTSVNGMRSWSYERKSTLEEQLLWCPEFLAEKQKKQAERDAWKAKKQGSLDKKVVGTPAGLGGQKALPAPSGSGNGIEGEAQGTLPGIVPDGAATMPSTFGRILDNDGKEVIAYREVVGDDGESRYIAIVKAEEEGEDDEEVELGMDESEVDENDVDYIAYRTAKLLAMDGKMDTVRSNLSSGTTNGTDDWCETCGMQIKVYAMGYVCGQCDVFYMNGIVHDMLASTLESDDQQEIEEAIEVIRS